MKKKNREEIEREREREREESTRFQLFEIRVRNPLIIFISFFSE
jgi:hypothetical protein